MKVSSYPKQAITVGILAGLFLGIVDIIIRLSVLSFEWFEWYQAVVLPTVFFVIVFLIFSLGVTILNTVRKRPLTKKAVINWYTITVLFMIIEFYLSIVINRIIFAEISVLHPKSLVVNGVVLLILFVVYLLTLFKAKETVHNIHRKCARKKVQKAWSNIFFFIVIFVVISAVLDVYLLYSIPSSSHNNGKPNILLITMDTTRADHLSLYGYERQTTPNIDSVGQEAVVFTNAISTSSWTLPAHTSMFTGEFIATHKTSRVNQQVAQEKVLLAEILRSKGYNTAGFAAGPYAKAKYGMAQGFTTYKDRLDFVEYIHTYDRFSLRETLYTFFPKIKSLLVQDGERTAQQVNSDVFRWLDKNKDSSFFIFINYFDPHQPHTPIEEHRELFVDKEFSEVQLQSLLRAERHSDISPEVLQYAIDLYDAEIHYLDKHIGNLIDKLDQLGVKENTVIIITADHGEEFYEHGGFDHGKTLYEEVIHVPLVISYPQQLTPKTVSQRVSVVDLFPTILELVEVDYDIPQDSQSLVPLLKNSAEFDKQYQLSELFGRKGKEPTKKQSALSDQNWKLLTVEQHEGLTEQDSGLSPGLYNLKTDPREQNNLLDIYQQKAKDLQAQIKDIENR